MMGRPLVDLSLERFDADGMQTVFAISPYGCAETRAERVARLEAMGALDPKCPGCLEFYEHPKLSPFAPSHRASDRCRSGGRPHCSCSACF